jgi:hypothetical protein
MGGLHSNGELADVNFEKYEFNWDEENRTLNVIVKSKA